MRSRSAIIVLTGGELPALVVIDAITRWSLACWATRTASWDDRMPPACWNIPTYTRPPEFRGWRVPEILVSGDHARMARWRREQSLLRTRQRRPDLLDSASLSEADRQFLRKLDEQEREQGKEAPPTS